MTQEEQERTDKTLPTTPDSRAFGNSAKTFETLPASAQAFIDAVMKKMRYRRKVRTEVREELTGHFLDALSDCHNPTERDKLARRMLTDFGDVKLLAILLRRAKRRCRPMWRTVVARTFQTIGAALLAFILYAVWFSTGRPTIRTDYLALANEMSRPDVASADNAWTHYDKALAIMQKPPESLRGVTGRYPDHVEDREAFADLHPTTQKTLSDYIESNRSAIESLDPELAAIAETAFAHGLVPYLIESGEPPLSWRSFDEAIEQLQWQACRMPQEGIDAMFMGPGGDDIMLNDFGLYYGDPNSPTLNGTEIAPDAQATLSGRLAAWAQSKSLHECETAQRAVNLAALAYWMEHPHPLDDPIAPGLYPFEVTTLKKWVSDNEATWRAFTEGANRAYAYKPYRYADGSTDNWMLNVPIGPLSEFRELSRLARWRARIAVARGDIGEAMGDCVTAVRAGGHLLGKGTIIEQLVGSAVSRLGYEGLLDILRTAEPSASDLDRVLADLKRLYPDGYPLMDLELERLTLLDTIQHTFTEGGPGGGHIVGSEIVRLSHDFDTGLVLTVGHEAAGTAIGLVHARRDATEAMAMKVYEIAAQRAHLTPYERRSADLPDLEEMLNTGHRFRYTLLHIMMPALGRASEIMFRGRAHHDATVTVLALERWRLTNGQYPPSLQTLVDDGLLDVIPMDPFSDKTLAYRRTDEGCILYSAGHNCVDDGGTTLYNNQGRPQPYSDDDGADCVYWPVPQRRTPAPAVTYNEESTVN